MAQLARRDAVLRCKGERVSYTPWLELLRVFGVIRDGAITPDKMPDDTTPTEAEADGPIIDVTEYEYVEPNRRLLPPPTETPK